MDPVKSMMPAGETTHRRRHHRSTSRRHKQQLEALRERHERELRLQEKQHQLELMELSTQKVLEGAAHARKGFDTKDMAPEDRTQKRGGSCPDTAWDSWPYHTGVITQQDHVVKGSFHIVGVNYSKYENAKAVPQILSRFHHAIAMDIVSEVGNGVSPNDIVLKLTPGAIDTVVLTYDNRPGFEYEDQYEYDDVSLEDYNRHPAVVPDRNPELLDATWRIKVEFAVKTRDARAQQLVGNAIYHALSQGYSICNRTAQAYVKYLDKRRDVGKIAIVPALPKEASSKAPRLPPEAPPLHATHRIAAPPLPRGLSPPRPPVAPSLPPTRAPPPHTIEPPVHAAIRKNLELQALSEADRVHTLHSAPYESPHINNNTTTTTTTTATATASVYY